MSKFQFSIKLLSVVAAGSGSLLSLCLDFIRNFTESEHASLRMKGAVSPEMTESKEAAKAKAASLKRPNKIRMTSFK